VGGVENLFGVCFFGVERPHTKLQIIYIYFYIFKNIAMSESGSSVNMLTEVDQCVVPTVALEGTQQATVTAVIPPIQVVDAFTAQASPPLPLEAVVSVPSSSSSNTTVATASSSTEVLLTSRVKKAGGDVKDLHLDEQRVKAHIEAFKPVSKCHKPFADILINKYQNMLCISVPRRSCGEQECFQLAQHSV
jgi:hypothetical protein